MTFLRKLFSRKGAGAPIVSKEMTMLLLVFFFAMILGLISARTGMIESRGGQFPTTLLRTSLGAISLVVTFSLFAWGFVTQAWYWPIVAFLTASIVAGLLVTRTTWAFFYKVQPVTQLLVTLTGAYLWLMWLDKGAT